MKTNGVTDIAAQDTAFGRWPTRHVGANRNPEEVISAILKEVPEKDKIVGHLLGTLNAYRMFNCPEAQHLIWGDLTQVLAGRGNQFIANEQPFPEWFQKIAAIFRGEI